MTDTQPKPAEDRTLFDGVMAGVFERIAAGRATYGPFDSLHDERDLRHEALEEVQDAIAYLYFLALKLQKRGTV
jgi:hypothetical protein